MYQDEGVSGAAILLQDSGGVDVNLVLLAAYVGAVQTSALDPADIAEAQRRVGAWQSTIVSPLRDLRRHLRQGPAPAPSPATDALRERIKAAELEAELVELDELARFSDDRDPQPRDGDGEGDAEALATAAIAGVVEHLIGRPPDAEQRNATSVIACAAARYAVGSR